MNRARAKVNFALVCHLPPPWCAKTLNANIQATTAQPPILLNQRRILFTNASSFFPFLQLSSTRASFDKCSLHLSRSACTDFRKLSRKHTGTHGPIYLGAFLWSCRPGAIWLIVKVGAWPQVGSARDIESFAWTNHSWYHLHLHVKQSAISAFPASKMGFRSNPHPGRDSVKTTSIQNMRRANWPPSLYTHAFVIHLSVAVAGSLLFDARQGVSTKRFTYLHALGCRTSVNAFFLESVSGHLCGQSSAQSAKCCLTDADSLTNEWRTTLTNSWKFQGRERKHTKVNWSLFNLSICLWDLAFFCVIFP